MANKIKQSKRLFAIILVSIMLVGVFAPFIQAEDVRYINGFDKGPSYTSVVPMKKATFVAYDDETLLDDYAYLAAVPTAVFKDQDSDRIFSYPLLFYQDRLKIEDQKELSLDAYDGIQYFMEDWMDYCGQLDQMTLINVDESKANQWRANEYTTIEENSPYKIASILALRDWAYSDNAVIAVINEDSKEFERIDPVIEKGTLHGGKEVKKLKPIYTDQLDDTNPRYHIFDVPEGYKYFKARTWWASYWFGTPKKSAFPININATIPAADPDSQFYCKYNGEWFQVATSQGWNIGGMDREKTEGYIYETGEWRLGITDVPTHKIGDNFGRFGDRIDIIRNMLRGISYQTDITLFPGEDLEIETPITPPIGCKDVTFKLSWSNSNVRLGFTLLGPSGEEILTGYEEGKTGEIEMELGYIGECLEGESYKISVFTLDDLASDVEYELEYSWKQNYSKKHADSLVGATEGAVLASALNAPLLYTSSSSLSEETKDALYTLGVEKVYLVNLGGHLSNDIKEEIKDIATIKKNFVDVKDAYKAITDLTNQNDIVFSTIDPWTKWLVEEKKPSEETEAGLFIGPAAYCAAHHGSPVLIVEYHPELSSATVYHNEFWKRHANGYKDTPVAPMYLTGTRVCKFLEELGLDKEGVESMITVAGQFEIGATWDRAFAGKTKPGRIFGSPVDTAYWISRNVFYPALIYNNNALNPNGVTLEQGSSSERRTFLPWGKSGLKITRQNKDVTFNFPTLHTYVCYEHQTNEAFGKYYGFKYKCADDIIPGETETMEPLDQDLVPGQEGAVWPDMSPSEVNPKYLERGGFDNVFSTSASAITNNLNGGVILWFSSTHGDSSKSGKLQTWEPKLTKFGALPSIIADRFGYMQEKNPWRAYEWYLGSTANPDTLTMEVHGIIPGLLGNPDGKGLIPLGLDYWPSERPIYHKITKLLSFIPIVKRFVPEWATDSSYYKDGVVTAGAISQFAVATIVSGYTLDEAIENIRSVGWLNTACLPAYNYMHLAMIRHGSAFQVIDPWITSWYSSVFLQSIPRDIILGDTVGEAYTKGISHVGILYIAGGKDDGPQWWWDVKENVCYFGDPDLRMFVPENEYSDKNTWDKPTTLKYDEELNVNGHMPFGATSYPHAKEPESFLEKYLFVILIVVVILILLIAIGIFSRKKGKKKK